MAYPAPSVSIVIPAFNESQRIAQSLRAIAADVPFNHSAIELLIVDDGSSDDTAPVAERELATLPTLRARILRYAHNRGKGYAVRHGLLNACAPIAVFSDADLSTPIRELEKLVQPIVQDNVDVTFGSRALDRAMIGVRQPWFRELGGRAFNHVLRIATGLPFRDTQCGFKAFRMSVCRPLIEAGSIDGFGFDIELLYEASRAGLRMREVPVRWDHRDGSKVNFLRDGVRMLRDVLTVRKRGAAGYYDPSIEFAYQAAHRDRQSAISSVATSVTT